MASSTETWNYTEIVTCLLEINLDISAILFRNFVQCPDLNSNFRVKDPYWYLINRSWMSFVMPIPT
jgi:hypothetical protein